jgi:hypothetical protein
MTPAPPPIRVNRDPVLTLWATVVAERFGYLPETPSTLGRFSASPVPRENEVVPNAARFYSTVSRLYPGQPGLLSVE